MPARRSGAHAHGPERTADLRRVVELVERLRIESPAVAVVAHPSAWREDLVDLLTERLPGAVVSAYDEVQPGADLSLWLALDAEEAAFQLARRDWERSGAEARGETLGTWSVAPPDDPSRSQPPASAVVPSVDLVFVPVSGVRPPRVLRLSWDDPAELLWDEDNAYLGELPGLLPLPRGLRETLESWTPGRGGQAPRGLVAQLRAALGPDFTIML